MPASNENIARSRWERVKREVSRRIRAFLKRVGPWVVLFAIVCGFLWVPSPKAAQVLAAERDGTAGVHQVGSAGLRNALQLSVVYDPPDGHFRFDAGVNGRVVCTLASSNLVGVELYQVSILVDFDYVGDSLMVWVPNYAASDSELGWNVVSDKSQQSVIDSGMRVVIVWVGVHATFTIPFTFQSLPAIQRHDFTLVLMVTESGVAICGLVDRYPHDQGSVGLLTMVRQSLSQVVEAADTLERN